MGFQKSVQSLDAELARIHADVMGKSSELVEEYGLNTNALQGKITALVGGPAVGKGTIVGLSKGAVQTENSDLEIPTVEFSKSLFAYCAKNQFEDVKIRGRFIDEGKLVPDFYVNRIFESEVLPFIQSAQKQDSTFGIFYDGVPRTQDQVYAVKDMGVLPDIAVFFNARPLVLEQRMYLRNLGLLLSGKSPREDAMNKERAKNRISEFQHNYEPLREAFKHSGTQIIDVSAERGPHAVYLEMIALLTDKKNSLFFNERDPDFTEVNRLSRLYMHTKIKQSYAKGQELLSTNPQKLAMVNELARLEKKVSDTLYATRYGSKNGF